MTDPRPIGVFDSGVGGLTVLREIVRRLPGESTIYLGDNARAPYGTRTDEEVLAFTRQALDRLVERDVKAVVIACNTSTAVALTDLRRRYPLPILGVIRPGAAAAALATRVRRVGVIATPATVRSHAYFQAIKEEDPAVEVYEHATPALVPMVEAGLLDGPEVEATVRDSLAALLGERDPSGEFVFPLPPSARIDTLLLGCTHYPLLRPVIQAVAGDGVAVVDSATATASALVDLLAMNGLDAPAGAAEAATASSRRATPRRSTSLPSGCSGRASPTSRRSTSTWQSHDDGPGSRHDATVAHRDRTLARPAVGVAGVGARRGRPRSRPARSADRPTSAWSTGRRVGAARRCSGCRAAAGALCRKAGASRRHEDAYARAMAQVVPSPRARRSGQPCRA